MRILYIDLDSQRPDHLGCYGYHRETSPNIDAVCAEGVRFDNHYATDVPCLPSRTALFCGRFGIHNGVIDHGGVAAEPFVQGSDRGFQSRLGASSWMRAIRNAGFHTATISPFGERHSAWHWYANFSEIHNTGKCGIESAEEVEPVALDWMQRNAAGDNWFLHLNLWDPHTPYRAPAEAGEPFKDDPIPAWYSEEVRKQHWSGIGPHSAQEVAGFEPAPTMGENFPRQPVQIDSMDEARKMFDGYDTGVLWADRVVGRVIDELKKQGVYDETAIIISADHGECLGELNIYGDHQLADQITTRVPLIIKWPGITDDQKGRVESSLHYNIDMAATIIELAGGEVPDNWDGRSFASSFKQGDDAGRDYLVVSQGAWSCQRSVRFNDEGTSYFLMRSYHDGYHGLPEVALFNLDDDPHEQHNLADDHPELVGKGMAMLDDWHAEQMRVASHGQDPMWTVINAGGAFHTRGQLPKYLERLRETGRGEWADRLAKRYPRDLV